MSGPKLKIAFCGLSITSSWGNGHAITYRGLVRELVRRGHEVHFLERDQPWYAANRDLPKLSRGELSLYGSLEELKDRFGALIQEADAVIVGSFVPEGTEVGRWVTGKARGVRAFYDIDTPVTLAALQRASCEYLCRELVPRYDLYLSFTGGPTLRKIEHELGSPRARALYCSVDLESYYPEKREKRWELSYLGTYSQDRQWSLARLLIQPARILPERRFVVAGAQYPPDVPWGANVERIEHLPPYEHRAFYNGSRYALNLTRKDMILAGYSPSIRLFEAAACGTPIISDYWPGLEQFFEIGREILVAQSKEDVIQILSEASEDERLGIGQRALERVRAGHTARIRALELERLLLDARDAVSAKKTGERRVTWSSKPKTPSAIP